MRFRHHCPFCGWRRAAVSATMLAPHCESCGGVLRAIDAEDLPLLEAEDGTGPDARRGDATTGLAALLGLPLLLPMLGVELHDIAFAPAFVMLAFAARRLLTAAQNHVEWRVALLAAAFAAAAACGASALAVAEAVGFGGVVKLGLYAGALGSAGLLVAAAAAARRSLTRAGWPFAVDAALLALVAVGEVVLFVVVPGFRDGDTVLTAIVVVDLVALALAGVAAVARRNPGSRRALWWLAGACAAAVAGDSAAAVGGRPSGQTLTAALWCVAGFALAVAADHAQRPPRKAADEGSGASDRLGVLGLMFWRFLLPIAAVVAMPATAALLALTGDLGPTSGLLCLGFALLALTLAFGRQAHLLLERQRAVLRERRLRHAVTRRNDELEALTGLATTMTQTLEEAPIIEQALGVLSTAARATSAALVVFDADGERVAAATGDWVTDREWRSRGPVDGAEITRRGGREMLRLPLTARDQRIGTVTLVRRDDAPFDEHGVELLRLLVDQMAVAVQNARDYREKLEQAISDPLTGVYNRRFLLEALEKEVQRSARYGSEASLVIFDVDDFKLVNDRHGHAAGDDVLRTIARTVEGIVRPADSFARIGGEEFALLLPQTSQFEALLVADRIRSAVGRQSIVPDRRVTLSAGVASMPGDAASADDLQRTADAALYWAKRNGKDLCAVASEVTAGPEDGEESTDRMLAHLYALVAMIDAEELHTRDHSENVAAYAVALGKELGVPRERLLKLRRAAMLHDIGKVAVASEILAKPSRLTDEEFAAIREHPVVGATMLAHAGLVEEAAWVRHHHERVDGRGYPDGVSGDALALEARILFVADAFEAITSQRPYSRATEVADALAEVQRCAGSQFDADVVEALATLLAQERLSVLPLGG